jgi:NADPH2:quinone reductase
VSEPFRAFRVFEEDGRVQGRVVDATLDDLSAGDLVIKAAYSSVNYKDALAATGAGKIIRRFPLVAGIDVAGTVASAPPPAANAITLADGMTVKDLAEQLGLSVKDVLARLLMKRLLLSINSTLSTETATMIARELGADVAGGRFREGQQVLVTGYDLGAAHDGGYAGLVRVPAEWVVAIPDGLSAFDVMAVGTAGFTAALSIADLERNGLTPAQGPVIVTGATGGVGSLAVQMLAARKYQVTALTGKDEAHDYLRSLGATDVISRHSLQMGTKPMEKSRWAGAVDVVGGETLAWLTRTMMYNGGIASSGLTGGTDLKTTVLPFILRGVKLLGIDSAMCPMARRIEVWRRIATDLEPGHLRSVVTEIGLDDLPDAFATLLAGAARGRYVVNVGGNV